MRTIFVFSVVLAIIAITAQCHRVSYAGYKLVDVVVRGKQAKSFLESLPEDRGEVRGVDVWTNSGVIIDDGRTVNRVMLSAKGFEDMMASGLFNDAVVISHDMEQRMAERGVLGTLPKSTRNSRNDVYDPQDEWYYHWHSYEEIQDRLQDIAKNFSWATYSTIGESHEGRKIGMLNIRGRHPNRTIALVGGTHAREWIAEGVTLWALGCITELYDKDKELTAAIDNLDLYISPCYNPDGYTYSRDQDRYWRKNRRDNQDGTFGVDQNRNWDADWGNAGTSHDTSSIVYCGPSVLSEPEPKAMHDFLHNLKNLSATIDFHSYSMLFMRPYAYTNDKVANDQEQRVIGDKFVEIVYGIHGTKYQSVRGAELYLCSGSCGDGAYIVGSNKSYVLELAGDDFVVPESDIQKQGEEIFAGLRFFLANA